ncbi:MAG: glycosyltransferase [Bacteroidetes bacterium]|jgi:glycosyltransferase involved in cell wall biosynthesis|nr:glycosyltransferase [Bacteroidota bacterium]
MPNPLVSIALCTYNGERFLSKQLDSLLSQSYNNIEIIVTDDCSTDNTWGILQDYADKDARLKRYKNEHNLGHTLNFEKAIRLCKGEYIALCDQDDVWETDKTSSLMESVGDAMLIYHNSDFIDEQDQRIGNSSMASKHRMYNGESCLPVILGNNIHGHAMLFSNKLKDYLFPFNKDFSHDWAIAFAAFNLGSVKYLDKIVVHYRQHQYAVTDFLEQRKEGTRVPKHGLERLGVSAAWLQYCLDFKDKKEPEITNTVCKLFLDLMNGKNKLQCFLFMLKHFDLLFYTMNKRKRGFFSKLNFARKLCYA